MFAGNRIVPLLSKASEPLPHGTLFVHVHVQEWAKSEIILKNEF